MIKFVVDIINCLINKFNIMRTLRPKSSPFTIHYVPTEIREVTTTDITYQAIDMELIKKYFPCIYKSTVSNRKIKSKGSKE